MTEFKKLLPLFILTMMVKFSVAQNKAETVWHNPAAEKFQTVHNQIWWGNEIKSFYHRLPSRAETLVRKEVWELSENAAGLKLVFNTNATEITIRYTTDKGNFAMPHFPTTGVSGLDLFAENTDGSWSWANAKYEFNDTITYRYTGIEQYKRKNGRKFHLYLPLYNNVKWLEIGVPTGNTFQFVPIGTQKPIIVYGTSIAQGGCASRPGMAWTNLLNRYLHLPVANLGFSGNGRLEKEVVDLIAAQDAAMFILDCLPNMNGEKQNIKSKIIYAVNTIRAKHPHTPIILADHSQYFKGGMSTATIKSISAVNHISYQTFQDLQSKGIKNLYYLKHDDIGLDMNDSVDGLHPTDIGMLKYARAYEKLIKKIGL